MADLKFANLLAKPLVQEKLTVSSRVLTALQPSRVLPSIPTPRPASPPAPAPPVAPAPPAPTAAPAPPVAPAAPGENPFDNLPFPSPGDRIKSEDFKALSKGIRILYDMSVASANLFGRGYGEARLALGTQGYQITRVMTVFGNEVDDPNSPALDGRKVIQVLPVVPGLPQVMVVLTEEVDTRRFVPNVVRAPSFHEALQQIQNQVGDLAVAGPPPVAPPLVGLSLTAAMQLIPK